MFSRANNLLTGETTSDHMVDRSFPGTVCWATIGQYSVAHEPFPLTGEKTELVGRQIANQAHKSSPCQEPVAQHVGLENDPSRGRFQSHAVSTG